MFETDAHVGDSACEAALGKFRFADGAVGVVKHE